MPPGTSTAIDRATARTFQLFGMAVLVNVELSKDSAHLADARTPVYDTIVSRARFVVEGDIAVYTYHSSAGFAAL